MRKFPVDFDIFSELRSKCPLDLIALGQLKWHKKSMEATVKNAIAVKSIVLTCDNLQTSIVLGGIFSYWLGPDSNVIVEEICEMIRDEIFS